MISLISVVLIIFYVYATFYIFMLNHRSVANYVFLVLNVNFSVSSLANYMLLNVDSYDKAYVWMKVYRLAILPVPVLLLVGILLLAFPELNKKVEILLSIGFALILGFWTLELASVSTLFYSLYFDNGIYLWRIRMDNVPSIIFNTAFVILYIPSIVLSLWWLKRYVIRSMNKWARAITIIFSMLVISSLAFIFQYLIIVKDGLYNGIFYFVLIGLPISMTYFRVFQERKLPLVTLNTYSEKIVDSLTEGVLLLDNDFQVVSFNQFAKSSLNLEENKVYPFSDLDKGCEMLIRENYNGKQLMNQEGALVSTDGKEIQISFSVSRLTQKKDRLTGYLFLFIDITKSKEVEKKLTEANRRLNEQIIWRTNVINERNNALLREIKQKEENRHRIEFYLENDYMTELLNKNGFLNVVNYARNITHSALILVEILNYKVIFESFSRLIAEQVIIEMSDFLKLNWKSDEVVMARFENSRFLLYCNQFQCKEIAESILEKFQNPLLIDGFKIEVECGIGITFERFERHDINQMIIEADLAIDEAKKYGCHQYYLYSEEMDIKNSAEFLMLNDYLYVALNENKLFIEYKLRFDAAGKPIGLIALVSWKINKDRKLEEKEIIEIAEKYNFAGELEQWRMKQLVKDLTYLMSFGKGFTLPIMVRVSKSIYYNEENLNQVIKILDENEIDKSLFEFALGEEIFMETTEFNRRCLANIRKHNIKVGLKHFGGLYSSLKYLRDLDIDFIVPAIEFIEGIGSNQRDEAILKKILAMAHNMNYHIVIQHINEKRKLDFLMQECNDFAGTFLFEASSIDRIIESLQCYKNKEGENEKFA